MSQCPSCSVENPDSSRFCSECGSALKPEYEATRAVAAETPASQNDTSDSSVHGRFLPGCRLANRYRIVSLLGRGGMGEVYRADDLKLGQTVALKFLPEALATDAKRLAFFHDEVRLARQVSHHNVCRVYDIGEVDGQHFLSMEYIDGEDLKSLLRRIGRLPRDKGIEIAKQLCYGLAAAHERGVLHRDLKPANVMLDGRGCVRITDFGLAVVAGEDDVSRGGGTPAYMAPEQLAGRAATVQSDLYSLGVLLFEILTGHRPSDLTGCASGEMPAAVPSRIDLEVDPAVDCAIQRCLERDPAKRPRSALAVAASLPGGDPLAAALSAGETPTPEMVAAAGGAGALEPRLGRACVAVLLCGLCLIALLVDRTTVVGRLRLQMWDAGRLQSAADRVLERTGFAAAGPMKRAYGFAYDGAYYHYLRDLDRLPPQLDASAMYFWCRQSPRTLVPKDPFASQVTLNDPPLLLDGMVNLLMDVQGHLLELQAVRAIDEAAPALSSKRLLMLFADAGLTDDDTTELTDAECQNLIETRFQPDAPTRTPALPADECIAWVPRGVESDQDFLRVEVATLRGRLVSFQVVRPWTLSPQHRLTAFTRTAGSAVKNAAGKTLYDATRLVMLVFGIALCANNIRLGRSDGKGAVRIGVYACCCCLLMWLFGTEHVPNLADELSLLWPSVIVSFFEAGFFLILYLGLEPWVRRLWPDMLISWSRLVGGNWHDARVGRDVLIGALFAVCWSVLIGFSFLATEFLGAPVEFSRETIPATLLGGRYLISAFFFGQWSAVNFGFYVVSLLLLFRLLVRNQSLAGSLFVSIVTITLASGSNSWIYWGLIVVVFTSCVWIVVRHGLLTFFAAAACHYLLTQFPITADLSAPYWTGSLFALFAVAALGIYGFCVSRPRPPLSDPLPCD